MAHALAIQTVDEDHGQTAEHLSYSRVNRYLLCPEQYRLYYVEKLRPRVAPASLEFGQAIHRALARFFQDGESPIEVFLDLWGEHRDAELRYAFRDSWEKLNECGQRLLSKFLLEEMPRLSSIEASEKPFDLAISNLEAPFVGIIDLVARVDGVRTVVDFKTSASAYQDFEVEMSDQLTAYRVAEPQVPQSALCVLVKTKEPRIEWFFSQRSGEALAEYLSKVALVGRQITDGVFYKRPGKWCGYCDFLPLCMGDQERADKMLVKVT